MFPDGELLPFFQMEWISQMAREARSKPTYSVATQDVARWARERIKLQLGEFARSMI